MEITLTQKRVAAMIISGAACASAEVPELPERASSTHGEVGIAVYTLSNASGEVVATLLRIVAAAPGDSAWAEIARKHCHAGDLAKALRSKEAKEAVKALNDWLQELVTSTQRTTEHSNSDDFERVLRFRARVREEVKDLINGLADGRIVRLTPFSGSDLRLAQTTLARFFPKIDRGLQILFLTRDEMVKGVPTAWSQGKDASGEPIAKLGECKKVGIAQADVFKAAYGYTPDFVVTVCSQAWRTLSPARRRMLIHHEICHIGYDDTKGTTWMVAHNIEAFTQTIEDFEPQHWFDDHMDFIHAGLRSAVEYQQLDLFGLDVAPVKPVKPKKAATIEAVPSQLGATEMAAAAAH
jgi:hypothetical protein